MLAYYLSHPEVRIDAAVPVPCWGLSDAGRNRLDAMKGRPWLRSIGRIVASDEVKAQETAAVLADALCLSVETGHGMHENDRSATGFLPPPQFEATVEVFFARPEESVSGWETAAHAQARIVGAVRSALAAEPRATLFVGHGGVGTLLACHIRGVPISRACDQGRAGGHAGGGNVHGFSIGLDRAAFGWTPMEQL